MNTKSICRLALMMVLYVPVELWAATITVGPGDCSASAVNAAIATASDGDVVLLTCTGTVAWTTTVSIPNTKGVTLAVRGGTNTPKTAAVFPLTVTSALTTSPTLQISVGPNKPLSRVTGFKFQNTGTAGDPGFIQISGQGQGVNGIGGFRFDNNYLDTISGAYIIRVTSSGGVLYGLIDNNTMHDAWRANAVDYGPYGIHIVNWWKDADGCWGKCGWTSPFAFGDPNFVFVEDNLFENVTDGKYMRHYLSAEGGGRYVARYNAFTVDVRSPANSRTDLIEGHGLCICGTTGTGTRGAEVYGNTIGGTEIGRHIMPRGGSWLIYDNTFLNLTAGSWLSPIYMMEYRAGDSGMSSQCTATCSCAAALSFVWKPSVTDASLYPLPQQVSGTYVWNNLYQGVNQEPHVDNRGVQALYIQAGRDYFVSESKPAALSSYTPYAYPHPLRGPAPPQNLRILK